MKFYCKIVYLPVSKIPSLDEAKAFLGEEKFAEAMIIDLRVLEFAVAHPEHWLDRSDEYLEAVLRFRQSAHRAPAPVHPLPRRAA